MLDITNVPQEYISDLAGAYMHATFLYEIDPLAAPAGKQRRIRKWICKNYADVIQKLPELVNISKEEHSAAQVLTLLKDCVDAIQTIRQQNEEKTEAVLASFDEDTKTALRELLGLIIWPTIRFAGKDIQIAVQDTPAYRKVITLCNAEDVPKRDAGYYCNDLDLIWQKEDGRYCLHGKLEDEFYETENPFSLTFETAWVEITVYNACRNSTMEENPWTYLRSICNEIGSKAELPGNVFNDKERKLMPLIHEICGLSYWLEFDKPKYQAFPELKALTSKYRYQKAEAMLEKLEKIETGKDKYYNIVQKLIAYLCGKKCAPLWREIYDKLSESQASYPDKAEAFGDKERLTEIRNTIQTQLEAKGYTGTYPDFVKTGPMKGIHLENSYNMSYWVGMEKRVQYHIHCTESFNDFDEFFVQFLCGTAFLKKDEQQTDIYDCLFNANGRRLFRAEDYSTALQAGEDSEPTSLDAFIGIAVKRAECLKLTKSERKLLSGLPLFGWGTFWAIFLIGGGLFSVAMTLAMMLMCIIITVIVGQAAVIPELLTEIPWGSFLAMAWILFGGAMGIIELLAHRK